MSDDTKVMFRDRLVPKSYPERHAQAQAVTRYNDFADGIARARIPYGDARDMHPGGITYATVEERAAYTAKLRLLRPDVFRPGKIEEPYVPRTDHRCPDCDVDVGEFHLVGCDREKCPNCGGQAISGCCKDDDEEDDEEDSDVAATRLRSV